MDTATPPLATATSTATGVALAERHLSLSLARAVTRFHYVWLRDNCGCPDCRVVQSGERRLFTAHIPDDIAPVAARVEDEVLRVTWNDGHRSAYSLAWLAAYDYSAEARRSRDHEPTLWDASLPSVPTFEHEAVVGTVEGQLAYLDAMRDVGVAVVRGTPSRDGEVARFAETVGHVRETAFERVHNVLHDPQGYNVAHTPIELKPHTDLPSYHWPPSVQLLHFLVNEATGGDSTVTDGWALLADLRAEHRAVFDTLTRVPVTFQLFSDTEDTRARAPMIQLDAEDRVSIFRFSNQLAQPLDAPFEEVEEFYEAYRMLGRLVDSGRYTVSLRANSGDLLTVHGHRVMHGRRSFDPTSGRRHLQDVYMEFDDLMARRRVLLGEHRPTEATAGVA